MTNQKDIHVAETVGYTRHDDAKITVAVGNIFFRHRDGEYHAVSSKVIGGYRKSYSGWKEVELTEVLKANQGNISCQHFLTKPTAVTDQIVLEWVQGQDDHNKTMDIFMAGLWNVLSVKVPYLKASNFVFHEFIRNYKPGMHAQALLAIQEERGD